MMRPRLKIGEHVRPAGENHRDTGPRTDRVPAPDFARVLMSGSIGRDKSSRQQRVFPKVAIDQKPPAR